MAATTNLSPSSDCTIKELTDSGKLDSVPPQFNLQRAQAAAGLDSAVEEEEVEEEIPTIDLSLLTGGTPEQRSQIVQDLGKACEEWGFFMVTNHGVPASTREAILETCRGFFELPEDEKREYAVGNVLDPIRCGTSFNTKVEDVKYWRDFIKMIVHPDFHSPHKPPGFREAVCEYSRCMREMAMELLRGISESLLLGVEECWWCMERSLGLSSGLQLLVGNLYPPCPHPEVAMGMPPHSDHGLLTVLLQNGVDGLHIRHRANWVRIRPNPNSLLVILGDHMEIFSNGKYKSVLHRATLNNVSTRMSIVALQGPSLETIVTPPPELLNGSDRPVAYRGMKYRDYVEYQQSNQLKEKSVLDLLRIPTEDMEKQIYSKNPRLF